MAKQRTGFFSTLDSELITTAYHEAVSFKDLLIRVGSREAGLNRRQMKERLVSLGLDPEALCQRGSQYAATLSQKGRKPLKVEFVENSTSARCSVRKYVLTQKVIPYECSECGMGPEWRGKKLSLVLDHINGVYNDDRIENLRFLCPNCNAQTPTFTGANRVRYNGTVEPLKPKYDNCSCGALKTMAAATCRSCIPRKTKIEWPSIEELAERVKTTPMLTLSKELGVSDKGLAKHLKKHGVPIPGPGHWQKLGN